MNIMPEFITHYKGLEVFKTEDFYVAQCPGYYLRMTSLAALKVRLNKVFV